MATTKKKPPSQPTWNAELGCWQIPRSPNTTSTLIGEVKRICEVRGITGYQIIRLTGMTPNRVYRFFGGYEGELPDNPKNAKSGRPADTTLSTALAIAQAIGLDLEVVQRGITTI